MIASHSRRRSIRRPGYDYASSGAYFVTLCVAAKECLFGDVVNGSVVLNDIGEIVNEEWQRTAQLRKAVTLGRFVIMPNHLHAVVFLNSRNTDSPERRDPSVPRLQSGSLGSVISGFKAAATVRINVIRNTPGTPVWQRNYHDHVIRDDRELRRIELYIQNNPVNWDRDEENPRLLSRI